MANAEHKIDKSKFGPGPWMGEPDRVEWRHKGVPCLIVRNDMGNLCGYAACNPDHPWFGKGYDETEDVNVHGGLTFAGKCHGRICHLHQPGEPEAVWWLGFDCAHCDDLIPQIAALSAVGHDSLGYIYRGIPYVTSEVESLAEQILAAK